MSIACLRRTLNANFCFEVGASGLWEELDKETSLELLSEVPSDFPSEPAHLVKGADRCLRVPCFEPKRVSELTAFLAIACSFCRAAAVIRRRSNRIDAFSFSSISDFGSLTLPKRDRFKPGKVP